MFRCLDDIFTSHPVVCYMACYREMVVKLYCMNTLLQNHLDGFFFRAQDVKAMRNAEVELFITYLSKSRVKGLSRVYKVVVS